MKKLSEDLEQWRCERPDEWIMDDFIRKSKQLESELLIVHSQKIEFLEKYSIWLEKNGYMDIDWRTEEPFAIDEFLNYLKQLKV